MFEDKEVRKYNSKSVDGTIHISRINQKTAKRELRALSVHQ